jgi:tRNA-specific 2-thiouridylase
VPPEILAALLLPLGELSKREVRERARAAGLALAEQPESQEVCFACDGYRGFLRARGVEPRPGEIVDESGVRLGDHQGHWEFTVGQRRGLGVAAEHPLFVLERRAATNQVVVGPRERLYTAIVEVEDIDDRGLVWLPSPAGTSAKLSVQLRYRSTGVPVAGLNGIRGGRLQVRLATPFEAPAAGQAAVFYDGPLVRAVGSLAAVSGTTGSV